MSKNAFTARVFSVLLGVAAACAVAGRPAAAGPQAGCAKSSRAYRVTVSFELTSPFVPDGRSSVAELAFRVIFSPVVFEFDPAADPLLGRCQVETGAVRGSFSRFVLNDVQRAEDRRTPAFLTPRPADFAAGIGIESEPTEDEESAATSRVPPSKIRLSFWTDFGADEIKWGSPLGTNALENLRVVFAAPFRDLLAGRARAVTLPYDGRYPEDKGTWKIEFVPAPNSRPKISALAHAPQR
jgi:hypothetical protein